MNSNTKLLFFLVILAAAMVSGLFFWEGHIGFSLWDEGFLWYGAQRVVLGEVPVRDFMAYDPGRYYWSAGFMHLMDDNGLVALRIAVAVFQAIGLFLALWLAARASRQPNPVMVILTAAVCGLWMFPRHKLFDITLSILLIAVLAYLIERPSIRRYFATGALVGFVALFGRNHGVYGAIGSLAVIIYLSGTGGNGMSLFSAVKWWLVGIVAGYLPMLFLCLFEPGFAGAFWESVRFLIEYKATNLPLPIPWPWLAGFGRDEGLQSAHDICAGFFFMAILAFGILGIAYAIWAKLQKIETSPVLIAAIFMALPYAHFAFSRADIGHLAQGIFPLLIGMMAIMAGKSVLIRISGMVFLVAASLPVTLSSHPGWQAMHDGNWPEVAVARDEIRLDPDTAGNMKLLKALADRYSPGARAFVATPFWPGAYAALGRKAPMWEIYALTARNAGFQMREIQRIQEGDPGFAIVLDFALDGREELRFRNTHPLVDQYIRDNFELLEKIKTRGSLQVYKNKEISQ